MFSVSWIVSVSLLIISFLGIILSKIFFAKPVDELKVSLLRMFPFEIARTSEKYSKYYSFFVYLFAGMCFSPLILIVQETTKLRGLNGLSLLITCLLGLAALCFIFLNVFDVTHTKAHLVLFGCFALLTFLSGVLISIRGITAYDLYQKHGTKEYLFLITFALSELVAIFDLIIMLNPKLKQWARLDLVDGKYIRPKKFPLAYSEWGILLTLFLFEIIYFTQLLAK